MHGETLKKKYNFYVTNIFKYKSVYILDIHFITSLSMEDVTEAISHRKLASVRGFEALSLLEFHLRFFFFHTRTSNCSTFLVKAGLLPIKFPHPGTR
jgi:hypothetical protein